MANEKRLSLKEYMQDLMDDKHPYCEKCFEGHMFDISDGNKMLYECDKCHSQIIMN